MDEIRAKTHKIGVLLILKMASHFIPVNLQLTVKYGVWTVCFEVPGLSAFI